ncbi:MAG: gliding motility-associated C-terminal domain-containing protein, partial [Bacteroidetes bacterium]|nr:gliding motility-associated C-terminal domain-containing protein [Bacteroidota bacterium]
NGCTAVDTVILTLEQRCEIIPYKGLSPNDDKVNDTWIIDGIESCPLNTVTIFNRWGDLIWEGENYDNDKGDYKVIWDGSNQKNDRILPDGTYFYVIDCNIERLCSVTGWVQIMR